MDGKDFSRRQRGKLGAGRESSAGVREHTFNRFMIPFFLLLLLYLLGIRFDIFLLFSFVIWICNWFFFLFFSFFPFLGVLSFF